MPFTPQAVLAMLEAGRAQTVTLRRLGDSPPTDVTCLAKIDGDTAQPLSGNMAQYQRRITISSVEIDAAYWPGPPRRNDQIITAAGKTLTIQAVDPVDVGDVTIMYRFVTLGA